MKKSVIITLSIMVGAIIIFYFSCINHVSLNEVGIEYNGMSGVVTYQKHPGIYLTSPVTLVAYLSTLPERVTIVSDARIINSKIVKLNPEHIAEFLKDQGFSWGLSTKQENIFLGYAYSGKSYPWLEFVQEGGAYNDSIQVKK